MDIRIPISFTVSSALVLNDEVCIRLDKDNRTENITMLEMVTAWQKQAEKYRSGEISKEEYDNWRYNYPTDIVEQTNVSLDKMREK